MQFDWWTFGFQLVNIAVLLWLLGRFLFRPVARIVAERNAETERVLHDAQAAREAAAQAEEAAKKERDAIAAERSELLEKAREEAKQQRAAALAKAREEGEAIVDRARAEAGRVAETERRQELRRASELAVAIAGRLLDEMPADVRIAGYPERLAKALSELGDEDRSAILGGGEGLRIAAPRALGEDELEAVRAAIRPLLPGDGKLEVEIDPTLIAGLELRSAHGTVRDSIGADLERVAGALAQNDKA